MKKLAFMFSVLFLVFFLNISLSAQVKGNGSVQEQTRPVAAFHSIVSTGPVDVFVRQGENFSMTVRADANLLPYIKTVVKNNTLYVSTTGNIREAKKMEVYVTLKALQKAVVSGSGDFYCKTPLKVTGVQFLVTGSGDVETETIAGDVQIKLSGSGDVEIRGVHGDLSADVVGSGDLEVTGLQLEACSVKLAGSGDVELEGRADKFTVLSVGSGDVDASGLTAVQVKVKSNSSGDVFVHAVESLDAAVVGSGDLRYSGNPTLLKVSATGSGAVYKR